MPHRELLTESQRLSLQAPRVHQNHWLKLAREGGQSTVQHLAELEPLRRYATLTALVLELTATLTAPRSLELADRLLAPRAAVRAVRNVRLHSVPRGAVHSAMPRCLDP
jgi:hypothetical protein